MEKIVADAGRYDVYRDFPQVLPPKMEEASLQYSPSCILVTGAAGFIGSHVAIRLARLYPEYRVVGVDKISYCSDERYVTETLADCPNFRFVKADVCNYHRMWKLMREEEIDSVLHLAAQSHVDRSFLGGGPRQFVMDNVMGTATLLELARELGVRRFIYCSTDEVYGEGTPEGSVRFGEDAKLAPTNPYAASKASADLMAQSFFKSFGFPVITTRGNNVYGPHQFYDKVIPKFITQLWTGGKITVHGSGNVTRNFVHVQDAASAFDTILHRGKDGEVYNISGRTERSVVQVADDVLLSLGLQGRRSELVTFVQDRPHNDACYPTTNDKLQDLGWRERLTWEFGLAHTVAWFTNRLQHTKPERYAKAIQAHLEWQEEPSHEASWPSACSSTRATSDEGSEDEDPQQRPLGLGWMKLATPSDHEVVNARF